MPDDLRSLGPPSITITRETPSGFLNPALLKVGLSLWQCVRWISKEEVKEEDVLLIFSFVPHGREGILRAIDQYQQDSWRDSNPNRCREIALRLLGDDKIIPALEKNISRFYRPDDKPFYSLSEFGLLLSGGLAIKNEEIRTRTIESIRVIINQKLSGRMVGL